MPNHLSHTGPDNDVSFNSTSKLGSLISETLAQVSFLVCHELHRSLWYKVVGYEVFGFLKGQRFAISLKCKNQHLESDF